MADRTGFTLVDRALLEATLERARVSPRRRMNHNFHETLEENPNRLLNAMLRGTYVAPHRHPPKVEAFLVLEGRVAFFIFDDDGAVRARFVLDPRERPGIDVAPGVWHTLSPLSESAVCYEVKPGPYVAAEDKDFAPWAPREGEPGAAAYLERLLEGLESACSRSW